MLDYVHLRQTRGFLQSSRSFRQRCLQTVRLRSRQPRKLSVQEVLQTAAAAVNGNEVLTDLCPTAGLPGLHTTGTQRVPETEEDTADKEGGTAGDTAGASSIKWWTGSGEERRCYDKEPLEGL